MPANPYFSTFKPLTSVLVKPAGADCNLRCTYCFYLEKAHLYPDARQHRMSAEVQEAMIKQVTGAGMDAINFGWQGGEPTLMGLDFYKQAIEFQRRHGQPGQSVGNSLQTNGTLLNEEWAEFLGEYNWLIGLSLDGPEFIHDHYRKSIGGEPTWKRVTSVARMLQANKVETNALCLVNNLSAQHPEEIYDYLKSIGLRWMQFIPCVETLPNDPTTMAPYAVSPEGMGEFLCRIFDKWWKDFENGQPTTYVRSFESVFHTYVGFPPPECTLLDECGCYVVVEHNGDVYSCDFFVEPECRLGNVLEGDLLEMLNSPRQKAFGMRKATLPEECQACPWLTHCRGGCLKERCKAPVEGGLNYLCQAYKMFFEHTDAKYKLIAKKWMERNGRSMPGGGSGGEMEQAPSHAPRRSAAPPAAQARGGAGKPGRNAPCPCGSGRKYKHCCG